MSDALKAGRELDERIGLDIMGWKLKPSRVVGLYYLVDERTVVRYPSQTIADAFLVVERMRELGWWCQMRTPWGGDDEGDGYWAGFTPQGFTGWNGRPDHWTKADTLPEAICLASLAALAAMKGKESNDATA